MDLKKFAGKSGNDASKGVSKFMALHESLEASIQRTKAAVLALSGAGLALAGPNKELQGLLGQLDQIQKTAKMAVANVVAQAKKSE